MNASRKFQSPARSPSPPARHSAKSKLVSFDLDTLDTRDPAQVKKVLQSLKTSFDQWQDAMTHPPWLESLHSEVGKIGALVRKIEHCQQDINSVKDLVYDKELTMPPERPGYYARNPKEDAARMQLQSQINSVNLLKSEIMMMKALVRRIELHQSTELNVFAMIRDVQRHMVTRQDEVTDEKSPRKSPGRGDGAIGIMVGEELAHMKAKMDIFKAQTDGFEVRLGRQFKVLMRKLRNEFGSVFDGSDDEHEDENESEVEMVTARSSARSGMGKRKKGGKFVTHDEYTPAITGMKGQLRSLNMTTKRLTTMNAIREANHRLMHLYNSNILSKLQKGWRKWKWWVGEEMKRWRQTRRNNTIQFQDLLDPFMQNMKKRKVQDRFARWVAYTARHRKGEKMDKMLTDIISYWRNKAIPSARPLFKRWRQNAFLMTTIAAHKAASRDIKGEALTPEELEALLEAPDYFMEFMEINPKDVQAQALFLAQKVGILGKLLALSQCEGKQLRNALAEQKKEMEDMKTTYDEKFINIVDICDAKISQLKLSMKNQMTLEKEDQNRHINAISYRVKTCESLAQDSSKRTGEVDGRLEMIAEDTKGLMLLNGEFLRRFNSLEESERKVIKDFDVVRSEIGTLTKRSTEVAEETKMSKESAKMDAKFLMQEVQSIRSKVDKVRDRCTTLAVGQSDICSHIVGSDRALAITIQDLEYLTDVVTPDPPTAKELFQLCMRFEEIVCNERSSHRKKRSTDDFHNNQTPLLSDVKGGYHIEERDEGDEKIMAMSEFPNSTIRTHEPIDKDLITHKGRVIDPAPRSNMNANVKNEEVHEKKPRELVVGGSRGQHRQDQNLLSVPHELMSLLANFAQRLAAHICEVTELEVLYHLVAGPQNETLRISSDTMATDGTYHTTIYNNDNIFADPRNGLDESIYRGSYQTIRKKLINDFENEFVELLKTSSPNPGYMRAQARVVFHRRFLAAFDTSLTKHLHLVSHMNISARVRQPYGNVIEAEAVDGPTPGSAGECIVCSRPLDIPPVRSGVSMGGCDHTGIYSRPSEVTSTLHRNKIENKQSSNQTTQKTYTKATQPSNAIDVCVDKLNASFQKSVGFIALSGVRGMKQEEIEVSLMELDKKIQSNISRRHEIDADIHIRRKAAGSIDEKVHEHGSGKDSHAYRTVTSIQRPTFFKLSRPAGETSVLEKMSPFFQPLEYKESSAANGGTVRGIDGFEEQIVKLKGDLPEGSDEYENQFTFPDHIPDEHRLIIRDDMEIQSNDGSALPNQYANDSEDAGKKSPTFVPGNARKDGELGELQRLSDVRVSEASMSIHEEGLMETMCKLVSDRDLNLTQSMEGSVDVDYLIPPATRSSRDPHASCPPSLSASKYPSKKIFEATRPASPAEFNLAHFSNLAIPYEYSSEAGIVSTHAEEIEEKIRKIQRDEDNRSQEEHIYRDVDVKGKERANIVIPKVISMPSDMTTRVESPSGAEVGLRAGSQKHTQFHQMNPHRRPVSASGALVRKLKSSTAQRHRCLIEQTNKSAVPRPKSASSHIQGGLSNGRATGQTDKRGRNLHRQHVEAYRRNVYEGKPVAEQSALIHYSDDTTGRHVAYDAIDQLERYDVMQMDVYRQYYGDQRCHTHAYGDAYNGISEAKDGFHTHAHRNMQMQTDKQTSLQVPASPFVAVRLQPTGQPSGYK